MADTANGKREEKRFKAVSEGNVTEMLLIQKDKHSSTVASSQTVF